MFVLYLLIPETFSIKSMSDESLSDAGATAYYSLMQKHDRSNDDLQ
jgi:hypothetical protein